MSKPFDGYKPGNPGTPEEMDAYLRRGNDELIRAHPFVAGCVAAYEREEHLTILRLVCQANPWMEAAGYKVGLA